MILFFEYKITYENITILKGREKIKRKWELDKSLFQSLMTKKKIQKGYHEVFLYTNWQRLQLPAAGKTIADKIGFHVEYKIQLRRHRTSISRCRGREGAYRTPSLVLSLEKKIYIYIY